MSHPECSIVDPETKAALRNLTSAIDSVSGMVAGCAAYIATLDGAAYVDRRKAIGLSRRLVPEGLSGDAAHSPARVAQAMVEEIGTMAREIQALKQRAQSTEPRPLARDWKGRPAEVNPLLDLNK
jgi:hypothetical protein